MPRRRSRIYPVCGGTLLLLLVVLFQSLGHQNGDKLTGEPFVVTVPAPEVIPHRWHVVEEFVQAADQGTDLPVIEGANSVKLGPEDLHRARRNIIVPLRPSPGRAAPVLVFNRLRDWIQASVTDVAPLFLDLGCELGRVVGVQHPNSTVLCLARGREDPSSPDPPNIVRFVGRGGSSIASSSVAPFFVSCNFASVSFFLGRVFDARFDLADVWAALPLSRVVIAAVGPKELEALRGSVHAGSVDLGALSSAQQESVKALDISIRVIAASASGPAWSVVVIQVTRSSRQCAKTWGAQLEQQWGRRLVATQHDGRISLRVESVKSNQQGLGRTIHPLQYIPSVNLDTLLGAGITQRTRLRLLGRMIATPRYSDPLPHNWIVGEGGRPLRIDKVDERYDRDVDERKGYWGRSTRGYLHLLAHHLCLPVENGLPGVFFSPGMTARCRSSCRECVRCSYLPKGHTPCNACLVCGECVAGVSSSGSSEDSKCQVTYSSMDAARKVWRRWEQADKRASLD